MAPVWIGGPARAGRLFTGVVHDFDAPTAYPMLKRSPGWTLTRKNTADGSLHRRVVVLDSNENALVHETPYLWLMRATVPAASGACLLAGLEAGPPPPRMIARVGWLLGALVTAYVAAFLAFALVPRVGTADLAVVLGNAVLADGQPSARLAARLDCALAAYRRGLVPRVLVSGGVGASGFSEAAVMRAYLVRAGVPEAAVLVDEDGVNTAATVRHTVAVMARLHLRSVLVVTQWFHVPRCVLGLRRAGVEAVFADYPRFVEWRDLYSTARELVAVVSYEFGRSSTT